MERPVGGDIASITARQANGDPLPAWLKFDPATGQFAGLPPDDAVASLAPPQSDNDIVTGSLPTDPDLGIGSANHAVMPPQTITVEVLVRDFKGNLAVTTFTIDLRAHLAGKQGWNLPPLGRAGVCRTLGSWCLSSSRRCPKMGNSLQHRWLGLRARRGTFRYCTGR